METSGETLKAVLEAEDAGRAGVQEARDRAQRHQADARREIEEYRESLREGVRQRIDALRDEHRTLIAQEEEGMLRTVTAELARLDAGAETFIRGALGVIRGEVLGGD